MIRMPANSDAVLMVKGLASGWKTMLLTVMLLVTETWVCVEVAKEATSDGPFGTVAGFQFAGVFQFPVAEFCCHVALPATARLALEQKRAAAARDPRRES